MRICCAAAWSSSGRLARPSDRVAFFDTLLEGTVESHRVRIPIIVLAAGSSRRMGSPKPLLEFGGRTCLSLVLSACMGSRAEGTVLVLGADADLIRAAAARDGKLPDSLSVVLNDRHLSGQTSTLKAGLEAIAADADGFMILPVDHPLITSDDVDALIERFEMKPRGRSIFIACHQNRRGHPVLFTSAHKSSILELGDDEPLHDYTHVREAQTEEVHVAGIGVISGMNTPEEHQRLIRIYRDRAHVEGRAG